MLSIGRYNSVPSLSTSNKQYIYSYSLMLTCDMECLFPTCDQEDMYTSNGLLEEELKLFCFSNSPALALSTSEKSICSVQLCVLHYFK